MTAVIKTVVGFDYGSYWTGIAVGQTLTGQATPLRAVRSKDWPAIGKILHQWQPQVLVVGLPLNMRGERQEMSARAERFARQLEGRFGIRTEMIDEEGEKTILSRADSEEKINDAVLVVEGAGLVRNEYGNRLFADA